MDELDADHKMYHYISDIVATLEDISNYGVLNSVSYAGDTADVEKALRQAVEIKEYLQAMLEIKIVFIEGPK